MNIKMLVAAHKKYQMPTDKMYMPIHVGAEGKESIGFTPDNTSDNISLKNPYYCELTGVYWAWKNLQADYIGLCHYRRYFSVAKKVPKTEDDKFKVVLTQEQLEEKLQKVDIVLPKKRNYFIESIYNHYKHTMFVEPLDKTGEILKEKYPEYYPQFEHLKHTTKMHAFNMFVMKKEYFDEYCTWLFDILGELENRVDSSQYSDFHKRFYGRVSERLLDVWLYTKGYEFEEIKVIDMQHINWFKKIKSFLVAKVTGKKYEASF